MAAITRLGFLALAVIFHLTYLPSILDIYFVSPIVSGMRLVPIERPPGVKPPADRLVLIVGDGLRADKAFQSFPEPYPESSEDLIPRPLAPFLRSRVLEHGTFGVSHTRVPTESRPGHVALIAGLYEDVSAVTTGWKLNPVNFDSVFNRSRHTWSWGSPDILPMFEQGAVPGKVDTFMYSSELEDFSQDATFLDHWVFDNVKSFFASAATNKTLNGALRQDKIVLFLHLLGLDTTGHSYRPYSKEYLNNIKVVDKGVSEIVSLIEGFYGDKRTAFVFTADHGMSDWGSHGDGHPDNTRTPLVAWGSGVASPSLSPGSIAPGHDDYSADWGFSHVKRNDVAQADIAPLMAHLLGIEFPTNSVGELPLAFLSASLADKARGSLANTQGILEIYRIKEEKKKATEIRYRPYAPLGGSHDRTPEFRVQQIRKLINAAKYEEAIEESAALFKIGLEGLRYLQTYDWLFLRALVTIGYLGWIAFALTTVVDLHVLQSSIPASRSIVQVSAFSGVLVAMFASFIISKSPATYYGYAVFPVFFWEEVYAHRNTLVQGYRVLFGGLESAGTEITRILLGCFLFVATVLSLALGYIHREIFTGLYLIGALWPCTHGIAFVQNNTWKVASWSISCLIMSTFTLLPAMKVESINLILTGGALMVSVGVSALIFEWHLIDNRKLSKDSPSKRPPSAGVNKALIGSQVGLVILAMVVTRSSALSLQAKQGLPPGNQVVGWLVLVLALIIPVLPQSRTTRHYKHRLLVYFLTFAPTFVILTISYEGLFYVAFNANLMSWVNLEESIQAHSQARETAAVTRDSLASPSSKLHGAREEKVATATVASSEFRPLALEDARIALFFFALLQSAFFSTGNIASVSSFSLESVCRLLPVFDPFSQTALLLFKILIPFALISANLGVLNKKLRVTPSALFMTVMAISDVLTMYFFWVVKDEGSWLEIGSTITHFAIASMLCVFVAALEGLSALFIADIEVDDMLSVAPPSPKT